MSYWQRLRRSWIWSRVAAVWLALGIVPLLFFQTAIHEGSHCVMMELTGSDCRVCAPFAVSLASGGGVYGLTLGEDETSLPPVAVYVAPQVLGTILVVALHALSRRPRDERIALLTRLWLLGASVDVLNNTLSLGAFGDWSVLASGLGLSLAQRLLLGAPVWLVIAWGLLTPLPPPREPLAARVRDLWPIGAAYAGISAAAVYVSLRVEVPYSDPTTLWHRVPILLQAGSVVVCLATVAAARLTQREAT